MATYKINSTLIHNGREYKAGDEIDLADAKVIEALTQANVIKAKTTDKPPAKTTDAKKADDK